MGIGQAMPEIDLTRSYLIAKKSFPEFLEALQRLGYQTIGPTIRDSAIVFAPLERVEQLPIGWWDDQRGGSYRLEKAPTEAWFEFVVGPHSLKNYTFPPRQTVLRGERQADGRWQFEQPLPATPPLAILGVRACDLAALAIQDRVFLGSEYRDESYALRRQQLFLIAVNCQRSAPTCFCHSMNCGPEVTTGFDLALTELDNQFVVQIGSSRGAEVLATIEPQPASSELEERARQRVVHLANRMANHATLYQLSDQPGEATAARQTQRHLNTEGIRDLLYDNLHHSRWDEVAQRCLSCGNCTMVCPTCFCSTVEDIPSLDESEVARERTWASCFTSDHSFISSGAVRQSTRSRYRQWLTHKLGGWIDQFGTSGCVGCGRCITWCPVGIDLTEEVAALRDPASKREG